MSIFADINKKFDKIINTKQRKLTMFGNKDKYMVYQRNQYEKQEKNNIKNKNKSETFRGSLVDTVLKIGVMFGALGLAKWLANPSNKDVVGGVLKFGKGLFDIANNIAGFGANNLLDGLSKIAGDKSILAKMFGGLQAVAGFFALKWLISPLSIIKDIKSIPKLFSNLKNVVKFLNMSLLDLAKWTKSFGVGIFKNVDKFFSRNILKIFGKDIWKYLRKLVNGVYKSVGSVVSKIGGGVGNFVGKMIPFPKVKAFGKFVSKIPIVGSLLGFGINILLGDPVEKATFKLATAGTGAWLGGLVGGIFPPAIPFTSVIGGVVGDWLGDTLYDKFIPPKLATGGIVPHQSKQGTRVIVAEDEDEVVIPLSMLTMDNMIGGKMFEPLKMIGSNILGAVQSVINTNGEVYSNINSDITASLVPLSKTFGITTIAKKSVSSGYIKSNNLSSLPKSTNGDNILIYENLPKITQTNILGDTTSTSVRGLLHSILDVIVNSDAISGGKDNMNNIYTQTPAIVQDVNQHSITEDVPGTLIGIGRATYYDPNDPNDKTSGGHTLSTGEKYNSNTFSGAVFPDIILKLPERYTAPTKQYPTYFKGKTIKKPFMIKMVQMHTGKQAYVRINDVGIGVKGDNTRLVDMSAATKKYFGGDSGNMKIYLAPDDAKPGALPNLPRMSGGGEYTFNAAPHKRWMGARRGRRHAGEDIDMNSSGTFQSWIGGTVVYKGYQPGKNLYGNYIDIYNEKLKTTERIAEAGYFSVKVGDVVQPGQIVSSGTSTGMIHYEIRRQDKYSPQFGESGTTDPIKYLSSIGAATISGNTIKNNALASLMDGSVNNNIATNNVTPNTNNISSIDNASIDKAFTDLSQMLGVGNKVQPNIVYKKINNIVDVIDKPTNTNIALLSAGNTNNIGVINQSIMQKNQSAFQNSRMRML